ncbi:nucleophile aminohydrolase [Fimicolochytrium jonesii]|uniref:nucleophile aminohydrolase n=1 Tax=Fimicolochytrium jonesii TaxID=1396493 RepID=UPI0022FE99DE|nr:nucleophile aminohydrolase [Fimicolochytrium jonesii]KAI8822452.1 nucleophile aminohydrolase [Fimicolochytrium jonesii]
MMDSISLSQLKRSLSSTASTAHFMMRSQKSCCSSSSSRNSSQDILPAIAGVASVEASGAKDAKNTTRAGVRSMPLVRSSSGFETTVSWDSPGDDRTQSETPHVTARAKKNRLRVTHESIIPLPKGATINPLVPPSRLHRHSAPHMRVSTEQSQPTFPKPTIQPPPSPASPDIILAVHGGAGTHAPHTHKPLLSLLRRSLAASLAQSSGDLTAPGTIIHLTCALEDSPLTNAGLGSNLTLLGTVECDAGMMDGVRGDFGAVGALSGVGNPIGVARRVMEEAGRGGVAGLVAPVLVVGEGAGRWWAERGGGGVDQDLVTEEARGRWRRHLGWLREAEEAARGGSNSPSDSGKRKRGPPSPPPITPNDTIGALLSTPSALYATASTGGTSLKPPGRISSAAHYGASIHARRVTAPSPPGMDHPAMDIACTVSGTGEQLITSLFAKTLVDAVGVHNGDCERALRACVEAFLADGHGERNVGVLLVKRELASSADADAESPTRSRRVVECWWAHTTDTFAVGYVSGGMRRPFVAISRVPRDSAGRRKRFVVEGRCVK